MAGYRTDGCPGVKGDSTSFPGGDGCTGQPPEVCPGTSSPPVTSEVCVPPGGVSVSCASPCDVTLQFPCNERVRVKVAVDDIHLLRLCVFQVEGDQLAH